MSTWDNAIRHTRALESALDTKLSNYSRIGADIAGGGGSTSAAAAEEGVGGYKLVEEEVEELLDKVGAGAVGARPRARYIWAGGAAHLALWTS